MGRYVFSLEVNIKCRKCKEYTALSAPGDLRCGHGKITEIRTAKSYPNRTPYFEYILEGE